MGFILEVVVYGDGDGGGGLVVYDGGPVGVVFVIVFECVKIKNITC